MRSDRAICAGRELTPKRTCGWWLLTPTSISPGAPLGHTFDFEAFDQRWVPFLSTEGKERQRRKVAAQAIEDFEASKALPKARAAVEHVLVMWAEKVGLTLKPAAKYEATVHAQIRDRLAAMKTGRLGFLERHAHDPLIASAILMAPVFLSGLDEPELALVKHKVEQFLGPEIVEAKAATLKAMKEADAGWEAAIRKIAERAGLTKGPDGAWSDPSISVAA